MIDAVIYQVDFVGPYCSLQNQIALRTIRPAFCTGTYSQLLTCQSIGVNDDATALSLVPTNVPASYVINM